MALNALRNRTPGCCCCLLYGEDFNTTTDIYADRYTITGDWVEGTNALMITNGSGTLVSTDSRQVKPYTWVFRITSATSNNKTHDYPEVDLLVAYADASNYIFLRIDWIGVPGSYWIWTVALFEKIGGVDSQLSETLTWQETAPGADNTPCNYGMTPDPEGGIHICVNGGSVSAVWSGTRVSPRLEPVSREWIDENNWSLEGECSSPASLGSKHGVIASATTPLTFWLDEILIFEHKNNCSLCHCPECEDGTLPKLLRADMNGVLAGADPDVGQSQAYCDLYYNTPSITMRRGRYHEDFLNPGALSSCYFDTEENEVYGYPGYVFGRCHFIRSDFEDDLVFWFVSGDIYSSITLGIAPVDCETMIDGLIMPLFGSSLNPYCDFNLTSTVSGTDLVANTVSVADNWSDLVAGQPITIIHDAEREQYTVVSVSGTGPTTIELLETIPGSRTGDDITRHAWVEISVIE